MSTPSQKPLTSKPPPPPSGGNLKYLVIGLLFLGGAVALWLMRGDDEPSPTAPAPDQVERVNPMQEPDLELEPEAEPEPEPEAPAEEPEPEEAKKPAGRKLGEWDCSGDLSGAASVVNANRAQIRSCYERRLKVNHVLQGDLKLKLKIGGTGKVSATQVTGSLRDQEVFSCVRSLAKSWTFPVPTGGNCAVLEVPFQFSPKP